MLFKVIELLYSYFFLNITMEELSIPIWAKTKKIRSIDHYMVSNFLNYKFRFVSFFLRHKQFFSNKIQKIFNTYFCIFMLNNQNDFNATRELYKFVLDNINKKTYQSTEISFKKENNITDTTSFKEKWESGFYYNYKSDNLYNRKYFISNQKLPEHMLSAFYNMADCTINIADAEGFGLSSLESLACGTPIISTMTGGLQDQIFDGVEMTTGTQFRNDGLKKREKKIQY